ESTIPSLPTPAATRYSAAGDPSAPAPTTIAPAARIRFCASPPHSGITSCQKYRSRSRSVSIIASGREERRADVALPGIRHHRDDRGALVLRPSSHLNRGPEGRTARDAGEDPLADAHEPRRGEGVLVVDCADLVDHLPVEHGGD